MPRKWNEMRAIVIMVFFAHSIISSTELIFSLGGCANKECYGL